MRILIVNVLFSPDSFGGATLVAERTAAALKERGHEVFILCGTTDSRLGPGEMARYAVNDLPVVALRVFPSADPEASYVNPLAATRLEQVVEMLGPDVVHFHAIQDLGVDMVEVIQDAGIPNVVTLHDAWWLCERQFMVRSTGIGCGQSAIDSRVCATCVPDRMLHERRQQRSLEVLARSDRTLAPSRFWADLMTASGAGRAVVEVNLNGVIHPRASFRRVARRGVPRIGFVGGLSPVKGYPQVIAALNHLRRSDYELHVVDSYLNLGAPSMSAVDWPVPGLVRVVPGYTYETIDDFFANIDVLLFPSQWAESFGLTVREALLRGVWPIVTDGGGPAEAIHNGVDGSVIPMDGGFLALAGAIAEVLDDPARLPAAVGPRPGITTFEAQVVELEGIYADVCSRAQGRPRAQR